jgi:sugar phosphate isomerase/epimerase
MLLGYNTNGLAHHDPFDAVELLAEIGYRSVALTIDHHCLSPYRPQFHDDLRRMRTMLERLGMRNVVETGARFLLDRYVKHEPTLMTADSQARARRIEFYHRCIDIAAELRSDCVSIWSGILRDDIREDAAYARLVEGLKPVLDYAATHNIVIGLEPEPGMFIDTMARYDRLVEQIAAPHFRLTLDIGHLQCMDETPLETYVRRYGPQLVNIHIEDMRRGLHEHLPFGHGEIDFVPVWQALAASGYSGGVHVELSRHSHEGPKWAAESFRFLERLGKSSAQ